MRACCASWRPSAATSRTSRPQRGTQSTRTSLCPAAMMAASATGSSPTPTSPRQAALRSHPLCYLGTIFRRSLRTLPHDVSCGNFRAFLQSATPTLFRDVVWLFPHTCRHMQFPCASMSAGSCGDRSAFFNNLYFVIRKSPRCSKRRCSVVSVLDFESKLGLRYISVVPG